MFHFVLDVSDVNKVGFGFGINSKILFSLLDDFTTITSVNLEDKFGLSSAALFYVMLLIFIALSKYVITASVCFECFSSDN